MKFALSTLLLLIGVVAYADELSPSAFGVISSKAPVSYMTFDQGTARAESEHKNLLVARQVANMPNHAAKAIQDGKLFCVVDDNDERFRVGITEVYYAPRAAVQEGYGPAPTPPPPAKTPTPPPPTATEPPPSYYTPTPTPPQQTYTPTYGDKYAEAHAQKKDMVIWVGVSCLPCEKKLSNCVHYRCSTFDNDSTPRVIVGRYHNNTYFMVQTFGGLPAVEQIQTALNVPLYTSAGQTFVGHGPQQQQQQVVQYQYQQPTQYYGGGCPTCVGGAAPSYGMSFGGGCASGSCGAGGCSSCGTAGGYRGGYAGFSMGGRGGFSSGGGCASCRGGH